MIRGSFVLLDCLTFDAEPIAGFLLGEPWAKPVTQLLQKIRSGDSVGYMNIVNLTEVYYVINRIAPKKADEKQRILRLYGLNVVPVQDNGLWREAALIKNKYNLSLADAFAVATAQAFDSKLVVGSDKQLNNIDIPIIKLRK